MHFITALANDSPIQGFNITANFLTIVAMLGGIAWSIVKYFGRLNMNVSNLTAAIQSLTSNDSDLKHTTEDHERRITIIEQRLTNHDFKRKWL